MTLRTDLLELLSDCFSDLICWVSLKIPLIPFLKNEALKQPFFWLSFLTICIDLILSDGKMRFLDVLKYCCDFWKISGLWLWSDSPSDLNWLLIWLLGLMLRLDWACWAWWGCGTWSPGGIWRPGGWQMIVDWGTEVDVDDAGNDDDCWFAPSGDEAVNDESACSTVTLNLWSRGLKSLFCILDFCCVIIDLRNSWRAMRSSWGSW